MISPLSLRNGWLLIWNPKTRIQESWYDKDISHKIFSLEMVVQQEQPYSSIWTELNKVQYIYLSSKETSIEGFNIIFFQIFYRHELYPIGFNFTQLRQKKGFSWHYARYSWHAWIQKDHIWSWGVLLSFASFHTFYVGQAFLNISQNGNEEWLNTEYKSCILHWRLSFGVSFLPWLFQIFSKVHDNENYNPSATTHCPSGLKKRHKAKSKKW